MEDKFGNEIGHRFPRRYFMRPARRTRFWKCLDETKGMEVCVPGDAMFRAAFETTNVIASTRRRREKQEIRNNNNNNKNSEKIDKKFPVEMD